MYPPQAIFSILIVLFLIVIMGVWLAKGGAKAGEKFWTPGYKIPAHEQTRRHYADGVGVPDDERYENQDHPVVLPPSSMTAG